MYSGNHRFGHKTHSLIRAQCSKLMSAFQERVKEVLRSETKEVFKEE